MTQKILEFNRLCAEFLGYIKLTEKSGLLEYDKVYKDLEDKYVSENSLKFHFDWNCIHEVVNAIKNTQNPKEHSDTTFSTLRIEIQTHLGRGNKEAVVEAIDKFLIWYEQNK